jgi:hypothetical protein
MLKGAAGNDTPLITRLPVPMFETVQPQTVTPPGTYAPIATNQGHVSPIATGVAGAITGAVVAAGFMASRKIGTDEPSAKTPKKE